jgi:4'-phosphopantetheinyl transferase
MIYIFYTQFTQRLKPETFNHFFQQLPPSFQNKIVRYRRWQDAQRSLLGKALLINSLDFLGLTHYSLHNLKFTKFERPYFDDLIDFNISHSGEYILCAISRTNKVGVDIEEIQNIPVTDFETNFSEKEWNNIITAADTIPFYRYWTMKEAFLKAIGMGLNVPLSEAEIVNNKITWDKKDWFLHEIKVDERYIAHLSSDHPIPITTIKKIDYN